MPSEPNATTKSAEETRQADNDDAQFVKNEGYFFELNVPSAATSGGNMNVITPLGLNPQSITLTEPYAATPTATIGGGLYVEEEGVIARHLVISGTTGFMPRPGGKNNSGYTSWGAKVGSGTGKVKSSLMTFPVRGKPEASMQSGQRQLQFLQDRIFRLYSDLKQNAATASGTWMGFHNPKDSEHYLVIPAAFTVARAAPRSTMYFYNIKLLVVGALDAKAFAMGVVGHGAGRTTTGVTDDAEAVNRTPRTIAAAKKDPIFALEKPKFVLQGFLAWIKELIADFNKLVGKIQGFANDVNRFIREIESIVEMIEDAIEGIATFVTAFADIAVQLLASFDAIIKFIENWGGARAGLYNILESFENVGRALQQTAIGLRSFDATYPLQAHLNQVGRNFDLTGPTLDRLQVNTTLQGLTNVGTGAQVGDAEIDRGRPVSPSPGGTLSGRSAREVIVLQGDTIQTLAARYMGDSSRSSELIALNNLRPPYISTTGIPNTLKPGDAILVPTIGEGAGGSGEGPTTYGARYEDSLETRLFSTDLRLNPINDVVGTSLYDLVLGPTGEDIQTTTGLPNLKQGLRTRMLTELGSDPLFPAIGYRRFVGLNTAGFSDSLVRISMAASVEADPRIDGVTNVRLQRPTPDALIVDFDAQPTSVQDGLQLRIAR